MPILQDTNTEIVYSLKVCMEPSYCHFMENTSCNMTGTNTCWQWSSWGTGDGRHRGMSVTYALPYSMLDSTDCHHITWITPALSLSISLSLSPRQKVAQNQKLAARSIEMFICKVRFIERNNDSVYQCENNNDRTKRFH